MEGRFADASNTTLLGVDDSGEPVVYKPLAGEQPLWDFPDQTLAAREVLAFEVSEALGFGVVPETVLGEGPLGPGAIQRFVEANADFDVVPAVQGGDERLWPIAVLDLITNNADRKLGHILDVGGRLMGIDHGLTFHVEDKLRTVLWVFAGLPVPSDLLEAVTALQDAVRGQLGRRIGELLSEREATATLGRISELLAHPVHPDPPQDRPPVPWPPY